MSYDKIVVRLCLFVDGHHADACFDKFNANLRKKSVFLCQRMTNCISNQTIFDEDVAHLVSYGFGRRRCSLCKVIA